MEEQKIKEIIEEMPQYKVNKIANEIAIRITNVFTELKDQYDELLKKGTRFGKDYFDELVTETKNLNSN